MIILGIDPGTATTGYAVVSFESNHAQLVEYGAVRTEPTHRCEQRLLRLHSQVTEIIQRHSPTDVAVEQLFFNTNVTNALMVGQARGVVLLAAASHHARVGEYTPLQVKQAVVGYGKATKQQVQHMVKSILKLERAPRPDDAADAVAVALCHAYSSKFKERVADAARGSR